MFKYIDIGLIYMYNYSLTNNKYPININTIDIDKYLKTCDIGLYILFNIVFLLPILVIS